MSPDPRYRLLVFDWDGTLIDSIGAIVGCTQATLSELGLPRVEDDRIRAVIGLGLRETVETICPGCDEETFGSIVRVYSELWIREWGSRSALFDGVPALLETLAREHYLLTVATAKGRRGLNLDFERTGVGAAFLASRTVDEAPAKPNPTMILDLLEETGTEAAECLMIGDTLHDLEMAANAGVDAVGVASGTTSREVLARASALDCLASVLELPAWLGQVATAEAPLER